MYLPAEDEGNLLGGILSIDGGRDDASSETCSFACGIKPRDEGVGVGHSVTWDTYGGGGARLHGDELGLFGKEATCRAVKGTEASCQTARDEVGHPFVEVARGEPHRIG